MPFASRAALLLLSALIGCGSGVRAVAQGPVIYDDDTHDDVDPGVNFATLHKLADRGELTVLATIADNSSTSLSPAVQKIYNTYYGRGSLPIGANKTSGPSCTLSGSACSSSTWAGPLVAQYDAGDVNSNYPDCVTTYRTVLNAQPAASVTIVETGFMTCLASLLASPGDGITSWTGAHLVQNKVAKLVVMGGINPSGTEYNFGNAPAQTAAVFAAWTTANGYPPIYIVDYNDGAGVLSGPPAAGNPLRNPALYAFQRYAGGTTQRGSWDSLAILYAARGLSSGSTTYFTDSGDGTNTINATTGANSWSSAVHSGHHYLTNALSNAGFSQILDGFLSGGFAGQPPLTGTGAYVQ